MLPIWKRLALNAYYHLGRPARMRQMRDRCAQGRAPWMILFYHRVADQCLNPWTTERAIFDQQMEWLQANFEMISLAEGQRRLGLQRNERPCVTITFDDGYAENCEFAIPLLIERKIPCTYFVTTGNVQQQLGFPHDTERGTALAPNTLQQLRDMAAGGIDIGSHTRWHVNIGEITSAAQLESEILGSQADLQQLLGQPVRYFAFPFGQHRNLSPQAFALGKQAYAAMCSAYGGYNFPSDDPFHLQRIHPDNDLVRLKIWMEQDRRKLSLSARYQYQEGLSLAPEEYVNS